MFSALPPWQQLAIYAAGAALVLSVLFRLPYVGAALRAAVSFGVLVVGLFLLLQQAPYQPWLAPLLARAGLDRQQVTGGEVRIPMSPDGHFWAEVTLNGVEARLLIDTGATLTGLSTDTAARAGVRPDAGLAPIFARTANGVVAARPATVRAFRLGDVSATDLRVAISPALGKTDVLGMNVLSRLAGWRVEGRTMILTPAKPGADQ